MTGATDRSAQGPVAVAESPDLDELLALPEDATPLEQAAALEAVQERLARQLSGAAR